MNNIHGGDIYRNSIKLDFSVNINPLLLPENIKRSLYDAIGRCGQYPDYNHEILKKGLAIVHDIFMDNILLSNGASEALLAVFHTFMPKKALIAIPSFYGYQHGACAVGTELIYYQLSEDNDFQLDEGFVDSITDDIDLVILANPANPTGKLIDDNILQQVIDRCQSQNTLLLLDECFMELADSNHTLIGRMEKYDRLLVLRAFTKSFALPGLRLGYLVSGNTSLIEKIEKHLPEWNISVFSENAGIQCLKYMSFLDGARRLIGKEKQYLIEELEKYKIKVFSSDANFILLKTDYPLYERLLETEILIRDCSNYKGLSKGYYRIAVKGHDDNMKLIKAIGECIDN